MNILTLGCSYTSWYWPTWPNYLQTLAGDQHRVVNVAHKGDSNFIIAHKLAYMLNRDSWDCVLPMWSGSTRRSVLIDSSNINKFTAIHGCDQDFYTKIYANTLGHQQYVNITEIQSIFNTVNPLAGLTDSHTRSDYDVFLGVTMLQNAGLRQYNMFYHSHDQRLFSIKQRLAHVGDFSTFDWIHAHPQTFPFDVDKTISIEIDVHPLPHRHFELAEKICDQLGIDKHNYTQAKAQAQQLTSKILHILDKLQAQVTQDNLAVIQGKYLQLLAMLPECSASHGHQQFQFP